MKQKSTKRIAAKISMRRTEPVLPRRRRITLDDPFEWMTPLKTGAIMFMPFCTIFVGSETAASAPDGSPPARAPSAGNPWSAKLPTKSPQL